MLGISWAMSVAVGYWTLPSGCRLANQRLLEGTSQVEELQKNLTEQGLKADDVSPHSDPCLAARCHQSCCLTPTVHHTLTTGLTLSTPHTHNRPHTQYTTHSQQINQTNVQNEIIGSVWFVSDPHISHSLSLVSVDQWRTQLLFARN